MRRWRAHCHIERKGHSSIESGINIGAVELKNAIKKRVDAGEDTHPLRPFLPHLIRYALDTSDFSFPNMPVTKIVIFDHGKGASNE